MIYKLILLSFLLTGHAAFATDAPVSAKADVVKICEPDVRRAFENRTLLDTLSAKTETPTGGEPPKAGAVTK